MGTLDCTLNKMITMYTERVGPGIADILKCQEDDEESIDRVFESKQNDEAVIASANTGHEDAVAPSPAAGNNFNNSLGIEGLTIDIHNSPGLTALTAQDGPVPHLVERFTSLREIWDSDAVSPCFLDSDQMVHYVLMKIFHKGATNMGFPAFDKSFKLTGFFQENAGVFRQNVVHLSLASLKIQASKVREVEKEFKNIISLDTADSKRLIKCLKDYKNLSEMKQDITQFLSSNVCI